MPSIADNQEGWVVVPWLAYRSPPVGSSVGRGCPEPGLPDGVYCRPEPPRSLDVVSLPSRVTRGWSAGRAWWRRTARKLHLPTSWLSSAPLKEFRLVLLCPR